MAASMDSTAELLDEAPAWQVSPVSLASHSADYSVRRCCCLDLLASLVSPALQMGCSADQSPADPGLSGARWAAIPPNCSCRLASPWCRSDLASPRLWPCRR